jgi:regulatory protein
MWRRRPDSNENRDRVIKDFEKSRERTMNRAVKLLAAKPRSIADLRERLLEKLWTNEEIVNGVIERLKEYGYLDDEQYARDVAVSKLRRKPQGKRRLEQAMSQKKLGREVIQNAIESAYEKLPEDQLIRNAIDKRIRLKGVPETREDEKKFYDHLMRLGFGYGLIKEKLNDLKTKRSDG